MCTFPTVVSLISWFCAVWTWWHFMSWVCEDFSNLNDYCFLCYTGLVVWQTDPAGPWLSHLWSSDVKTCHVRVYVFILLWEKSLRRQTETMAEGSTQPRPPPGKCLFKVSLQKCQIWIQTEPSRGSGGGVLRFEVGEILLCLSWNEPISLNTSTLPKVWTDKSAAPLLIVLV